MTIANRTELASAVSGLSDSQLLEQTGKLASLDRQIQIFVIDHLYRHWCRRRSWTYRRGRRWWTTLRGRARGK